VDGGTAPHYRDFQLGGGLGAISVSAGVPATDAKTIHERPALLQDLEWRRGYTASNETAVDSVQRIAFSFYDDQLFRLVIDYDRERSFRSLPVIRRGRRGFPRRVPPPSSWRDRRQRTRDGARCCAWCR
jgi:hypothetical protein